MCKNHKSYVGLEYLCKRSVKSKKLKLYVIVNVDFFVDFRTSFHIFSHEQHMLEIKKKFSSRFFIDILQDISKISLYKIKKSGET